MTNNSKQELRILLVDLEEALADSLVLKDFKTHSGKGKDEEVNNHLVTYLMNLRNSLEGPNKAKEDKEEALAKAECRETSSSKWR